MRFILLIPIFFVAFNSFACTEAMKAFEFECKVQDRYNKLSEEFTKNKIMAANIKGFAIPRALGKTKYFASKNDLLNHTEATLAADKDWTAWKSGQKFLEKFTAPIIEYNDITKLHKTMFSGQTEAGKVRTNFGETNPKIHYSCNDNLITDEVSSVLDRYDVESVEGYPLLSLENLDQCEGKKNYSADLVFYKGASMKTELKSWINDFNDMLGRYTADNSNEKNLTSPYAFLADMKRRFLAIHPFVAGNELLANMLIEYATKKVILPSVPTSNANDILLSLEENRQESKKSIEDNLTFFENCLYETKVNFVSPQCTSL